MEIQRISEEDVFKGKSFIQPLVDTAAENPGDWFQVEHKSAQLVGRLRKYGLEAVGRRNEDKTVSTVQFRLPVGGSVKTPAPIVRKEAAKKAKKK